MAPNTHILVSIDLDATRPAHPLAADFDPETGTLHFWAHSPTGIRQWDVPEIRTAADLWDALQQAKREHEAGGQ